MRGKTDSRFHRNLSECAECTVNRIYDIERFEFQASFWFLQIKLTTVYLSCPIKNNFSTRSTHPLDIWNKWIWWWLRTNRNRNNIRVQSNLQIIKCELMHEIFAIWSTFALDRKFYNGLCTHFSLLLELKITHNISYLINYRFEWIIKVKKKG